MSGDRDNEKSRPAIEADGGFYCIEEMGGDGLHTRHRKSVAATDENITAWMRATSGAHFWDDLSALHDDCERIIAEFGWDRNQGSCFPDDRTSQPYSPVWYAGQIGSLCWIVLQTRDTERGLDPLNCERLIRIGRLLADREWRKEYKDTIVRKLEHDRKNREHGGRGGQSETKRRRHDYLNAKACGDSVRFLRMSDAQKVREAQKWAADQNRHSDADGRLFIHGQKPLTRQWFEAWLTDFYEMMRSQP